MNSRCGFEPFAQDERVLVVAPHPDDEAIGCAGAIQQAKRAGARVRVVYVTHGGHNLLAWAHFGMPSAGRRRDEALRAMDLLGLVREDLVFLGHPDLGFDAESVRGDFRAQVAGFRPSRVFVTGPFDRNADHRGAYHAMRRALSDLAGGFGEPEIFVYPVHARGWPYPRKTDTALPLLPPDAQTGWPSKPLWMVLPLSPEEAEMKRRALLEYKSQSYLRALLMSFARANELFMPIQKSYNTAYALDIRESA